MTYVRYIDRTREYYAAEGYEKSYRWAHFDDVPFTPLPKPLAECTVTLVSTSDVALKADRGKNEQSHNSITGNVYSLPASTPADDLYSMQEHYDANATHLDDVNSFFPITRLQEAAKAGRIRAVAARVHGVYTSYSHRKTLEVDGPEMLRRCREDGVDVAVMTPVCPVCHQTISLVARYLEESSIPTVVIATARDIVEHCGVARLVFVDFPLGNPCGEPFKADMQREIVEMAFGALESASAPRTTIEAPYLWPHGDTWKDKIFTKEQPFMEGEAHERWIKDKQEYREMKAAGRLS
jgi:glycine/betaine/sarcosine/D-proline reductase family selenoprotein B